MKKHTFDYDLVVIGSGASGSTAATVAVNAGMSVAIVEADKLGGNSVNYGEIPTKALLHAANLYDEAKHGAKFGLRSSTLGYNYPALRTWRDLVVKRAGINDSKKYYENQGITTLRGWAHFLSPNEISVNRRHISAKEFLIATGSEWSLPKITGLSDVKYWTPKNILEALRPPKSLLIIGGDNIAVETAQLMATFGTKVYIVEAHGRLLPRYDEEVGNIIEKVLSEQKGVSILTKAKVISVEKEGLLKRVLISRGNAKSTIKVDEILVAKNKTPNTDIGLENAGVKYDKNGIIVNEWLQTSVKHIFAAGDVVGPNKTTQTLIMEGQSAAHNILEKTKLTPNYSVNPEIVFTNPGVAVVGMTESECQKQKIPINKSTASLCMVTRSNTSDFDDGFVKIITNKKGVLIGATIVAPHAGEMIHELALAIKCGLTVKDIASTPHHFLSWSEAVRVAASKI